LSLNENETISILDNLIKKPKYAALKIQFEGFNNYVSNIDQFNKLLLNLNKYDADITEVMALNTLSKIRTLA
jgi:predicted O-methyltransferase YrrM